ncbi:MAG: hypothetical protein HRU20_12990 [Pseudomonadales bacterium]|nr:hypothetical protein [Pseudomonadales bacterium]
MLSMVEQLVIESHCMVKHALSHGLSTPSDLTEKLFSLRQKYLANNKDDEEQSIHSAFDACDIKELTKIHNKLALIIAPATPKTITLLSADAQNANLLHFLGPVALIRQLSCTSIVLLLLLIFVSTSSLVNLNNINAGFFSSDGLALLLNETFLLCCAGLGASFSGLFRANKYVADGTYDPKYDSSYWSSLILGFMAGIILVELLPQEIFTADDSPLKNFGKPALSLLSGFSANMIYRLLQRFVDTFDHFIRGDQSEVDAAKLYASQAQLAEKQTQMKVGQAAKLMQLQNALHETNDMDSFKKQINDFVADAITTDTQEIGA